MKLEGFLVICILILFTAPVLATPISINNPSYNLLLSGNLQGNNWCNNADLNRDGVVNADDYFIIDSWFIKQNGCSIVNNWCSNADINHDSVVNADDYFIIDSEFIKGHICTGPNPSNKGYGNVLLWYGNQLQVIALNMKPKTSYTLVYTNEDIQFGGEINCVLNKTTNNYGQLSSIKTFNYLPLLTDGLDETFVLAPSSSVDCANNEFIHWPVNGFILTQKTI